MSAPAEVAATAIPVATAAASSESVEIRSLLPSEIEGWLGTITSLLHLSSRYWVPFDMYAYYMSMDVSIDHLAIVFAGKTPRSYFAIHQRYDPHWHNDGVAVAVGIDAIPPSSIHIT
jgi:hypothetical protein